MRLVLLSKKFIDILTYIYSIKISFIKCEKIPMAFYNCEWYNECKEFKQLIRMMILRTNRKFSLNISWFTTMSLPTFLVVREIKSINANLLRLILIFVFSDGKNKRIIFFIIKTFGGINITHIIYYLDTINL